MEEDGLISILGDKHRALILRLAVSNPTRVFTVAEVAKHFSLRSPDLQSKVNALIKEGVLAKKRAVFSPPKKSSNAPNGFTLNLRYPFLPPLQRLVRETVPYDDVSLFRALTKMRGMRAVVATGVFTDNQNTGLDVLLVGDGVNEKNIIKALKTIEQEYGFEVRYALLEPNDFIHRISVADKMVRNILDYPYTVYLDRMGSLANQN